MKSDLYFNEDHEQLRRTVRSFVDREINPHVDAWEARGLIPLHDLFKKMGDLGLLGIRYDPAYGGQGLDYWFETAFLEELGNIHCGGVPMAITVQTNMATPAIHEFGSEFLKQEYLKPALTGERVAAIAVTEPDAGSDVAAIKTTARRQGDTFVVNGSKTYITNGTQADFLTLLARSSDAPGYHAFSLLVVPTDLPGFQVSRKLDKVGMRSSDTAELFFDDVKVPAENLIGQEGEGFIQQMKQFQHERFSVLPIMYVSARNIVDSTVEYLRQRVVFGKPLITKQVLRHRLADWLTETECLKQLTYHIVRMKTQGRDATKEISMAKLFGANLLCRLSEGCLRMHGGMGYMTESRVSRAFLDAYLASIGGGANEIMSEIVARMEGF